MAAVDFFEKQSDGSLRPITLYELQADGSLVELVFTENGDVAVPDPPTITATMPTRTTATVTITPSTGGEAVVNWEVFRDGVSVTPTPLPSSQLVYNATGLPTATPEIVFTWQVRGIGASGQAGGLSNSVATQWQGNPQQPPAAPTSLASSNVTTSGFTLTWAESALSGMQKHTVRYGTGGTILKDDVGATATSTNVTGLTQDTAYNGVYVTRTRASDGVESGPSPTVNVRTLRPTGGVQHQIRMGASNGDEGQGGITNWEAMRIYRFDQGDLTDWISKGVTVFALTANQGSSTIGAETAAATATTRLTDFLEWFYYGSGSASRQNVKVHFATDNETDRNYGGSALPAAYVNCYNACYNVIHTVTGGGVRRYPNAMMCLNFTHSNIESATKAKNFKVLAPKLDLFTCSMYPPGRQQDKNGGHVDWTPYSRYTDGVIDVLQDWVTTGGAGGGPSDIQGFATWEIGMPIDHSYWYSGIQLTPPQGNEPLNGEPTGQTNFSIRPRYFAGGRDSAGTNWVGYLQYLYNKLDALGIPMYEQCYWDQQDNPNIPDPLRHDTTNLAWDDPTSTAKGTTRANPDTAHAWLNWTPGSKLPDA